MRRMVLAAVVFVLASCADPAPAPRSEPSVPERLDVTCDGERTEILTPTVRARSDGLHVLINNTSDVRLSVDWPNGGEGADPGITNRVVDVLPGPSRVRCVTTGEEMFPEEGNWAAFQIEQPAGWISPTADCAGTMYRGFPHYTEEAVGVEDALADARHRFRNRDGDVVQAGYATGLTRTFVLIDNDVTVAGLVYRSDGEGGWLQTESYGCSD